MIGILGGTFDPVHNGHLQLAQYVFTHGPFQKILFIPSYQPPHRNAPIASPEQRLEMLAIALEKERNFEINDCEIRRKGISYMIDTLIYLHKAFPEEPLCLILGTDAFAKLNTWHRWKELLNYVHLIVIDRPDISTSMNSQIETLLKIHETKNLSDLQQNKNGKIFLMKMPSIPISATQIRENFLQGKSQKSILPTPVLQYINQHFLYH